MHERRLRRAAPARRRSSRDGRRRAMAVRRRRRQVGASMRSAPSRANGSRKLPSPSATKSGRPSTRPQDCHSATMSSALGRGKQRQRQSRIVVFEHDGDRGRCGIFGRQRRRGAAGSPRRETPRPACSAPCACRAPSAAAPRARGADRRCGGARRPPRRRLRNARAERRGRAAAEHAHRAARPGSDPAGFHLTPRKTSAPAGLLPPGCRDHATAAVAIGLRSLVKGWCSARPRRA